MALINLTREFFSEKRKTVFRPYEVPLRSERTRYTGIVVDVDTDSMAGSYVDFPGHILETDDGRRGDNVDAAEFFRQPATVLHLDKSEELGGVTAEELRAANHGSDETLPFLVINAIGKKDPHDVPWRGIYLDMTAVEWILHTGCRFLLSDVYESERLEGVFLKLFQAGVVAACEPVGLYRLGEKVLLSVVFPRFPAAQIPCAFLAETLEEE